MSGLERYLAAAHAMQTGVAVKMQHDPKETEPKHLRVGINSAMCDHAALVRMLIDKGIITQADYEIAVADEMQREVERYQKWCEENGLGNVTLA